MSNKDALMKYFRPGNDPNQHVCLKCKDEKTQDLRHGYTILKIGKACVKNRRTDRGNAT